MSKLEDLVRLNMYVKQHYHGELRDYKYDDEKIFIIYKEYSTQEIKKEYLDVNLYMKIIKGEFVE